MYVEIPISTNSLHMFVNSSPPFVKTEAWDNDVVIVSGVELSNPALRQSLS